MSNVMFKRGSQSDLNKLTKYVDGSFYLTTDTDRLYVAQSSSELVELNKSITIVDYLTDLPTNTSVTGKKINGADVAEGQFYYIKTIAKDSSETTHNGNILAVCSSIEDDGTINWVQVNPDTNTNDNTVLSGLSFTKSGTETIGGKKYLVYDVEATQKDNGGNAVDAATVTATFKICADDLNSITGVSVGLNATDNTAGTGITLGTTGVGGEGGSINIVPGNSNISIAINDGDIAISGVDTTYGLVSKKDSTSFGLVDAEENAVEGSQISLTADETYISLDGSAENGIAISHKLSGVTTGTYGTNTTTSTTFGGSIIIPTVTVDAAGHITSATDTTVTLPNYDFTKTSYSIADPAGKVNGILATDDGKLTIHLASADGEEHGTTSEAILYNKIVVDGEENTVYNQQSLGSFYSATAIDKKMRELDAMVYRGVVSSDAGTDLPDSNVKIGDTYKVNSDGNYAGNIAYKGDMFIATGTEYTDEDVTEDSAKDGSTYTRKDGSTGTYTTNKALVGTIIPDTLQWTIIDSGNYPDTTYTMSIAGEKDAVKLILTSDVNSDEKEEVTYVAGANIDITNTSTDDVDDKGNTTHTNKITIEHEASGVSAGDYGNATITTDTATNAKVFQIPTFSVDAQGHITTATNANVSINFANTEYVVTSAAGSASGTAAIRLLTTGGDEPTNSGIVLSGNKWISATGNATDRTIAVNHKTFFMGEGTYGKSSTTGADAIQLGYKGTTLSNTVDSLVVPTFKVDEAGHIIDIKDQTITMPVTDNTKYVLSATATVSKSESYSSITDLTTSLKETGGDSAGDAVFGLVSNSLTMSGVTAGSGENNRIAIDIVWGDFS